MLLDGLVSAMAPFLCVGCSKKGYIICPDCQATRMVPQPSRCYRCHKATKQFQVCVRCRSSVKLDHVWVATEYSGIAKEALELLKFERAAGASKDIARVMTSMLPLLPEDTLVCYTPTTAKRIRIRGYDQAKLIAVELAKQKNLTHRSLIKRSADSRQVGSSREDRFKQAEKAFEFNQKFDIKDSKILIVDDVTTSGATIEAIARILKRHGAKQVDAVLFAQAVD